MTYGIYIIDNRQVELHHHCYQLLLFVRNKKYNNVITIKNHREKDIDHVYLKTKKVNLQSNICSCCINHAANELIKIYPNTLSISLLNLN